MEQAKVSIIINCHNGDEFLAETLESIKRQTYQNYEIVFYDNFSDDNSANIAKSFGEKLNYYKSSSFLSLGAARNEAIKLCKGEYIAFIDADDLWDEKKLETQVKILDENEEIGMVLTNFRIFNMMSGKITEPKITKNIELGFENFVLNYSYCLSTFVLRQKCIQELPSLFDERLHYAEEYDLFLRIAYRWNAYSIGIPLATRRMHSAMNSIKLAERISLEHQIVLDNMRRYIENFDVRYPSLMKKICYLRDYMDAKVHFIEYKNKKIRKMMLPYIFRENRAMAYYIIALFPQFISTLIIQRIYKNHI